METATKPEDPKLAQLRKEGWKISTGENGFVWLYKEGRGWIQYSPARLPPRPRGK